MSPQQVSEPSATVIPQLTASATPISVSAVLGAPETWPEAWPELLVSSPQQIGSWSSAEIMQPWLGNVAVAVTSMALASVQVGKLATAENGLPKHSTYPAPLITQVASAPVAIAVKLVLSVGTPSPSQS